MTGLHGKVAAVTGAGSGIGRALAVGLAQRGARVAVCDVDGLGLGETVDLVKGAGGEVHATTVDVRDRAAVAAWAAAAAEHFGAVHQVYNNAGIGGATGRTAELDLDGVRRVLDVNLWGVIHGTQEFLPHLIASGDGHVVNISSLNGFMAQPGMAAYCASKFAVRGFTESVRAEMLLDRRPVAVTVVHPGGVQTNIANASLAERTADDPVAAAALRRQVEVYNEKLFTTTAPEAARQILDAVQRRRPRVLIGQARTVDRLVRLLPASYPRFVAAWQRRTLGDLV